ncbi:hypothetical protein HY631_04310 [Candidatus Uhrbacteria bacterium]|nr:hypothetical protein [Candidatus Uhrbacteria bacterium]
MEVTFVGTMPWENPQDTLKSLVCKELLPVVGKSVVIHFPLQRNQPDSVELMDAARDTSGAFHVFLLGRFPPWDRTFYVPWEPYREALGGSLVGSPIYAERNRKVPMGEQVGDVVCLRVRMQYREDASTQLWMDRICDLAQHLKKGDKQPSGQPGKTARQMAEALVPYHWKEAVQTKTEKLRCLRKNRGALLEAFLQATQEAERFVQSIRGEGAERGALECQEEVDRLFQHPLFQDAWCVSNGSPLGFGETPVLLVRTKEILVSMKRGDGGVERRRIGRFEIRIPFVQDHNWGNNVHFRNLDRLVANQQGPHIDDQGWPCFGTGEQIVDGLFKEGRLAELVEFCLHYLTRVNTDDGWGKNIHEWPLVEDTPTEG